MSASPPTSASLPTGSASALTGSPAPESAAGSAPPAAPRAAEPETEPTGWFTLADVATTDHGATRNGDQQWVVPGHADR